MAAKEQLAALLREADVEIDGPRAWDMRILDERFYARVFAGGSLAAGEAYMEGWWEVDQLDDFFARIQRARLTVVSTPSHFFGEPCSARSATCRAAGGHAGSRSSTTICRTTCTQRCSGRRCSTPARTMVRMAQS